MLLIDRFEIKEMKFESIKKS